MHSHPAGTAGAAQVGLVVADVGDTLRTAAQVGLVVATHLKFKKTRVKWYL